MNTGKMTLQDVGYAMGPAFLYTICSNLIYFFLKQAVGGQAVSGIMLQAATSLVCLAIFGWWAAKEKIRFRGKETAHRYLTAFCYVAAVVACGVACNYLISLTQIKEVSSGYRHVTEVFYGNSLLLEIVALCVLGPLLEEIVYRGFVYRRLCGKCGRLMAAVLSALVFGVLHFNLVQCIYAFLIGLMLAYVVAKTESLLTAIAAHMAVNLASVLWTETNWLDFLNFWFRL